MRKNNSRNLRLKFRHWAGSQLLAFCSGSFPVRPCRSHSGSHAPPPELEPKHIWDSSSGPTGFPCGSPHTPHSHSHTRFPRAESWMSGSMKQFIHGAVTQKQLKLVPPRRDPEPRNPPGFHRLTVQARDSLGSFLLSHRLLPFCECPQVPEPLLCKVEPL